MCTLLLAHICLGAECVPTVITELQMLYPVDTHMTPQCILVTKSLATHHRYTAAVQYADIDVSSDLPC